MPVVNEYLLELNNTINNLLESINIKEFDKNYTENQWIPHVSLGVKLSKDELKNGINTAINNFENINVKTNRITFA
jgi:2'-5' RNA ligase